jgi:hypothetical protein
MVARAVQFVVLLHGKLLCCNLFYVLEETVMPYSFVSCTQLYLVDHRLTTIKGSLPSSCSVTMNLTSHIRYAVFYTFWNSPTHAFVFFIKRYALLV